MAAAARGSPTQAWKNAPANRHNREQLPYIHDLRFTIYDLRL
jgi:hypothetical protein